MAAFSLRNNNDEKYNIKFRYSSEEMKRLIGDQMPADHSLLRNPDTLTIKYADSLAIFTEQRCERERKVRVRYAAGNMADHSSKAVIPWILYAIPKEGGRSIYISYQEPDSLKSKVDERANTLVGLLGALYLSPDVKATLHTRLALRVRLLGGLINLRITLAKQDMLEAQMPCLVLMSRDKVIKGSFITQATEFLDSQVGFNI